MLKRGLQFVGTLCSCSIFASAALGGYAALSLQNGSPNANAAGTEIVAKLRYELDKEINVGQSSLSFSAAGLLQFGSENFKPFRTHVVQEANATYETDHFALRFGRQLILWGVADGFNPTDVITPRNFQMPSHGLKEPRFGVDALKFDLALGDDATFTAFAITRKPTDLWPSGFDPTDTLSEVKPIRTKSEGYGARLNWQSSLGDFNISAFHGPARGPLVFPTATGLQSGAPDLEMIGFDFATVVGSWRLYTELAFSTFSAGESSIADQFLPNNEFQAVVGAEKELEDSSRLAFQFFYRDLRSERSEVTGAMAAFSTAARQSYGQFDTIQTGASISHNWESQNTDWSTSLTVSSWFQNDTYVRARAKYRVNDNQSIYLYGDWFDGPSNSPFGYLSDTSSISLEYRLFF